MPRIVRRVVSTREHGTRERSQVSRSVLPLRPELIRMICADVLLRTLGSLLGKDEELSAFADDTAMVVASYTKALPSLCVMFEEFGSISGLCLNIRKTFFIPLWPSRDLNHVRTLISELCPAWRDISIAMAAKYLGFILGPVRWQSSWEAPLRQFLNRAKLWASFRI